MLRRDECSGCPKGPVVDSVRRAGKPESVLLPGGIRLFNIGPAEMIVILVIALIVFGPKRLPEIGRTVGKSLREFRRASQDLKNEFQDSLEDEENDSASTTPDGPAPT